MCSDTAIKISNVCKHYEIYAKPIDRLKQALWRGRKIFYNSFKAIDGVSFQIDRGTTVGIIGKNGAGKSTLLQIICGTLVPTVGDITVTGRVAALLELGSGFNPEFSGKENVFMSAAVLGLTKVEIEERYQKIVDFADIGPFIDQPVKTYSSGMYVRLAFAVVAHVDADILVIDEALAVGDAYFTQKCMRFLRAFKEKGTLLFVSHDIASVVNFCDKAIWLENGRVRLSGSAKEVTEQYLEQLYLDVENLPEKKNDGEQEPVPVVAAPPQLSKSSDDFWDQRLKFINNSNLRNDIEVFRFDEEATSFGKGGVHLIDVALVDGDGRPLSWVVGGESVTLRIQSEAIIDIDVPIVGFYIKDRLGQTLFGDNTYLTYKSSPLRLPEGSVFDTKFTFNMPFLPVGDYSINVAIGQGTQDDHTVHCWSHDALIFSSRTTSVSTGLIGIPIHSISIELTG